jgi:hypothetical protein
MKYFLWRLKCTIAEMYYTENEKSKCLHYNVHTIVLYLLNFKLYN